ncbi:MAG: translocation/assembly module TamB domain-containing protein [Gammaproteobacteria bacterium]
MKLRWLVTSAILLIPAGGLILLINTEAGLNWAFKQAISFVPGRLSIDAIEGTLAGNMSLSRISYQNQSTKASIDNVTFNLSPGSLLNSTIKISSLDVNGIYISHHSALATKDPIPPLNIQLPLNVQLSDAKIKGIVLEVNETTNIIDQISLDNLEIKDDLVINALDVSASQGHLNTSGDIRLTDKLPLSLSLSWRLKINEDEQLQGAGKLSGNLETLILSQQIIQPFSASIAAEIPGPLQRNSEKISINGTWQSISYPLNQPGLATLSDGEITVNGTLNDYRATLEATLIGTNTILSGPITMVAHGDQTSIDFEQIEGHLLDGLIAASGRLSWQPTLNWQFHTNAEDIHAELILPELPGTINLTTDINGEISNNALLTQIDLIHLDAILKDIPIQADGHADINQDHINLSDINIYSGENRIYAQGTIQKQFDITWNMSFPDIRSIVPSLGGSLKANGKLGGNIDQPQMTISLLANNLAHENQQLTRVSADVDIDLSATRKSNIQANVTGIKLGDIAISQINLQGAGKPSHHDINVTVKDDELNATLAMAGEFGKNSWKNTISKLTMSSEKLGLWSIAKPSTVMVTKNDFKLDSNCLTQNTSRICLSANWTSGKNASLILDANTIPVSLFDYYMPPEMILRSTLDHHANIQYSLTDKTLTGQLSVQTDKGILTYVDLSGNDVNVEFSGIDIKIDLKPEYSKARMNIGLTGQDYIKADLETPETNVINLFTSDRGSEPPIKAHLSSQLDDLSLIPALVHEIDNLNGSLVIDGDFNGTINEPKVIARLNLSNASFDIPRTGLSISNIKAKLDTTTGDLYALDASLNSGSGTLSIDGEVAVPTLSDWRAEFSVQGENAEVINIPEAWMTASPNLNIIITPETTDLTGELKIPSAKLEPRSVELSKKPSDDVIFTPTKSSNPVDSTRKISSIVKISLGNKVKFEGFGLTGDFAGDVAIIDTPGQLTTAYGELFVKNGVYQAYGQDLTIDKGRLLFVGGPASNPGLDIKAVRKTGEIIAGVNARGTLQSPYLSVFSESDPPLSESDALSYLLFGRPMNQASRSEGKILYGAAAKLGFAAAELLVKQIGEAFNLDEVRIETDSTTQQPTLVIGEYLSPRLYISYGLSTYNTFRLLYNLTKNVDLDAQSGLNQGADIIYTIETQ